MTNEMNNHHDSETCAFCGQLAVKTVHKDKLFGKGMNAIVIENLPLKQCTACGESYYEPETSQLIDQLLSHPEKQSVIRQVNVVSLAA